jgi:hypothetical protein
VLLSLVSLLIILAEDVWMKISEPDAMSTSASHPIRRSRRVSDCEEEILAADPDMYHRNTVKYLAVADSARANVGSRQRGGEPKAVHTGHFRSSPSRTAACIRIPLDLWS